MNSINTYWVCKKKAKRNVLTCNECERMWIEACGCKPTVATQSNVQYAHKYSTIMIIWNWEHTKLLYMLAYTLTLLARDCFLFLTILSAKIFCLSSWSGLELHQIMSDFWSFRKICYPDFIPKSVSVSIGVEYFWSKIALNYKIL